MYWMSRWTNSELRNWNDCHFHSFSLCTTVGNISCYFYQLLCRFVCVCYKYISISLKSEHNLVKATFWALRIWDSSNYNTYAMVATLCFLRLEGRQSMKDNYTWPCSLSALSVIGIYFTAQYVSLFQTYSMWYWFNFT